MQEEECQTFIGLRLILHPKARRQTSQTPEGSGTVLEALGSWVSSPLTEDSQTLSLIFYSASVGRESQEFGDITPPPCLLIYWPTLQLQCELGSGNRTSLITSAY